MKRICLLLLLLLCTPVQGAVDIDPNRGEILWAHRDTQPDMLLDHGTDNSQYFLVRFDSLPDDRYEFIRWADPNNPEQYIAFTINASGLIQGASIEDPNVAITYRNLNTVAADELMLVGICWNTSQGRWNLIGIDSNQQVWSFFNTSTQNTPEIDFNTMCVGRDPNATSSLDMEVMTYVAYTDRSFPSSDLSDPNAIYNGGNPNRDPSNDVDPNDAPDVVITHENSMDPTVGSYGFGIGISPTFVDDGSLSTNWSYTANTFDTIPSVRTGRQIPKSMNVDTLWMGDSFSPLLRTRLPMWAVSELAQSAGVPIKRAQNGMLNMLAANGNPIDSFEESGYTSSVATVTVAAGNSYAWQNEDSAVYMALPTLSGYEFYSSTASGQMLACRIKNIADADVSGIGAWANWFDPNDDTLRVTPIFYGEPTKQMPGVRLVDGSDADGGATSDIALSGLSSGVVGTAGTHDLVVQSGGGKRFEIHAYGGSWDPNEQSKYLGMSGILADNQANEHGIGIFCLSDASWSLSGFSSDTSSTGDKTASNAEVTAFVDAVKDDGRLWLVFLNIATEVGFTESTVQDYLDETETMLAAAGIDNYRLILVSQFLHAVGSIDLYGDRKELEESVVVFDTLAAANSHVWHVSLYKLTGGCYFHHATASNEVLTLIDSNSPQAIWLADYDTANSTSWASDPGPDMLDTGSLHTNGVDRLQSQHFFGTLLASEIWQRAKREKIQRNTTARLSSLESGL